jgi:cytoskeletal protein CcmA (bactofilin family)
MGMGKKKRRMKTAAHDSPSFPPVSPSTIEIPGLLSDGLMEESPPGDPALPEEQYEEDDICPPQDEPRPEERIDEAVRVEHEPKKLIEKESNMTNVAATPTGLGEENVTTVLADDLEVNGTVKFKSSLMIKGVLDGEIISEGLLIVGPTAKVTATITTKDLISHGEIKGDVTASGQVILKETAVHTGDITTPNIVLESGSIFNGSCVMVRAGSSAP